ncbi:MAG: HAD family phosphatase [Lachnospiraceae bacterium]|nr:HAD family phosphatase [Lachnospiraceae bacterium]
MYKNIIFDVGEVMFSYRWVEALAMGGISLEEAKVVGPKAFYDPLWTELDLGIRPYFDVVSDLSKAYPEYSEAITNFLTNVENMPLDRPRVWEKVHELKKKGYRLFLLSNYSEYMFSRHTKGKPFIDDMDGMMISYMVHICKPDEGIYRALLEKYDLDPTESLFLDDRPENVEGAAKCGIEGIVVTGEDMLLGELDRLINEAG